ncbi:MAG: ATP-dependent DNA helicase DinG [Pseudomonadales bacterium]
MLTEAVKKTIQTAYSTWLEARGLTARYGQRLMIAEIAKSVAGVFLDTEGNRCGEPGICVVEAGTGTGKTVAYTLAALPVAQSLGKKLVIATATVALQEQIVYRDFPDIKKNSGLKFEYGLAKGRGRYLCLSKLDTLLSGSDNQGMALALYPDEEAAPLTGEALGTYQSMLDGLADGSWDGDRDNWPDIMPDPVWRPITTDHAQCTGRRCAHITECLYFKARENLDDIDCIIANQDLVLADLALGGGAILPAPEDCIYVFDEGHQLPDKALNHFANKTRVSASRKWLDQTRQALAGLAKDAEGDADIQRLLEQMNKSVDELQHQLQNVWEWLESAIQEHGEADGENEGMRWRLEGGHVPDQLAQYAIVLAASYDRLAQLADRLSGLLDDALAGRGEKLTKAEGELWYPLAGQIAQRAKNTEALWLSYRRADPAGQPPKARWMSFIAFTGGVEIELASTPIMAADSLTEQLWKRCCGAVITSATLTALQSFDRFVTRSGVPESSQKLVVPSPFDYFNAASLHVPAMKIDPGDNLAHNQLIIDMMPQLVAPAEGTLVLFSSRRQMLAVYEGLQSDTRDLVLLQDNYSKQVLIKRHQELIDQGQSSIIFGLASFAEGIDLPGNYCTHVVIAKLPFAVPDDPVEATLADWIKDRGGNPFMEISVPDAAIKLVQASGRLLRKEDDRGRITLLDRRVVSRRYGKALLDSLPNYRREIENWN